MRDLSDLTLVDFWPLAALGLLLSVVVIGVFRGLRRKPDGSRNKDNIGGGPYTD